MNLTVFESVDAALAGVVDAEIDAWLQQFLRGEGDNVALAEGLLAQRRFYLGPVLYPLTHLQRCCGPEPDIEFPVHADRWVAKDHPDAARAGRRLGSTATGRDGDVDPRRQPPLCGAYGGRTTDPPRHLCV